MAPAVENPGRAFGQGPPPLQILLPARGGAHCGGPIVPTLRAPGAITAQAAARERNRKRVGSLGFSGRAEACMESGHRWTWTAGARRFVCGEGIDLAVAQQRHAPHAPGRTWAERDPWGACGASIGPGRLGRDCVSHPRRFWTVVGCPSVCAHPGAVAANRMGRLAGDLWSVDRLGIAGCACGAILLVEACTRFQGPF